ncbi:DinB family protein [Paenibacillus sp. RC84]|uniref:DinB family protein n=1 Tax=Paenibacillus sp. RC84 TaxID=3156252 RepID=UPI003512C41B
MSKHQAIEMYRFHNWANETIFNRLKELPESVYLDQWFMLDNPYTRKRDTSYAEVLFQVANHGTYHRGNLSAMLRQIGQSSVMIEYALYWYTE